MRGVMVAVAMGAFAFGIGEAAAEPAARDTQVAATDLSAQYRRPPSRLRVYPGRLLYRDCTFRLARQWRPSGPVIVPVQRCWWVRG